MVATSDERPGCAASETVEIGTLDYKIGRVSCAGPMTSCVLMTSSLETVPCVEVAPRVPPMQSRAPCRRTPGKFQLKEDAILVGGSFKGFQF